MDDRPIVPQNLSVRIHFQSTLGVVEGGFNFDAIERRTEGFRRSAADSVGTYACQLIEFLHRLFQTGSGDAQLARQFSEGWGLVQQSLHEELFQIVGQQII